MVVADALTYPLLNLSPWLEPRRLEYQDHLLQVSLTGDYNPWVEFFCQAVRAQASDGVQRVGRIVAVREEMIKTLLDGRVRGTALDVVEDLIGYPVITVTQAARLHDVSYPTANSAIQRLVKVGILREVTGRNYGRVYFCQDVMQEVERP